MSAGDELPYQFPLIELGGDETLRVANFCTHGGAEFGPAGEYHAAEDYHRPAGTPVYAMADGEISFSGPMGGYGWLIIVDHPDANLYSLYGHLSPSRWRMNPGPVEKGDLIAYLGDPDENGGTAEHPMRPHLHFGVRAGQRADYSGMGEWRWQAGWIKPCPVDAGWLQPSAIIKSQAIPHGGYHRPGAWFVRGWWLEVLFAGIYVFGGACMLVYGIRADKLAPLLISGAVALAAGWVFRTKGALASSALFALGAVLLMTAVYRAVRASRKAPSAAS
jgi:murein DD-endopeptidase MepM/ murein hydrolase activator NlpD